MAKYYKYTMFNRTNIGTEENPIWHEYYTDKMLTVTEANEEIVAKEAYNGEYTIEDDGLPEREDLPTTEERLQDLEEAFDLFLSGVTE